MGRTLGRTAAFVALWRQLRLAHRGGPSLGRRLASLPRLIGASLARRRRYGRLRYDGLWRVLLMAAALVYLVWPIDLIPELLLGPVGLIDDGVVLVWLAGAVLSETSRFLQWEGQLSRVVPGQLAEGGPIAGGGQAAADQA